MTEPLRIDPGERTADEIVDELKAGRRILVTVEMLGQPKEISLRYDGELYYCDTPTRLHKHSDEAEMRDCVQEMGYGK
jgi:hypothetical protein